VILGSASEVVSAFTNPLTPEREAALEASDVDTARLFEIDSWFHCTAPVPSYKFAKKKKKTVFFFYPVDGALFLIRRA
jgi:hypothetical protein